MFYTTFAELCSRRGIRPGRAAGEIGISRAAVTRWKQEGFTPRGDVLERIAAYFGVTVDYLLRGGIQFRRRMEVRMRRIHPGKRRRWRNFSRC